MLDFVMVGQDLLLPEMGVVHVDEIKESGAAVVLDQNGRRWLVSAPMLANAELCLFATE